MCAGEYVCVCVCLKGEFETSGNELTGTVDQLLKDSDKDEEEIAVMMRV
jgi:hypothetical protein